MSFTDLVAPHDLYSCWTSPEFYGTPVWDKAIEQAALKYPIKGTRENPLILARNRVRELRQMAIRNIRLIGESAGAEASAASAVLNGPISPGELAFYVGRQTGELGNALSIKEQNPVDMFKGDIGIRLTFGVARACYFAAADKFR